MACGIDRLEALESELQTRMLILFFVFEHDFFDFGAILERFWALTFDCLRSFFENVNFMKFNKNH